MGSVGQFVSNTGLGMFPEAAQNCPLILIIGKQTGYTKKTHLNYALKIMLWDSKKLGGGGSEYFHPASKLNIWPTQIFQIKASLNYARIFSIFQS